MSLGEFVAAWYVSGVAAWDGEGREDWAGEGGAGAVCWAAWRGVAPLERRAGCAGAARRELLPRLRRPLRGLQPNGGASRRYDPVR